jgi:hypothetical protein
MKNRHPQTEFELMNDLPRIVVHMRAQKKRGRLGLIFGSGASHDLGFPDWESLVKRVAKDRRVKATALLSKFLASSSKKKQLRRSLASITQMLFAHYREESIRKRRLKEPLTYLREQEIRSAWLKVIYEQLYRGVNESNRRKKIERHPYLMEFLEIIKNSPLTVNYNFDDTLEKMLLFSRTKEEQTRTRGYETTYKPNCQFQKDRGIIYHPNGFLPMPFQDGSSPEVVFSDDSFQDQLISAATGKYIHLSNHLLRNTCLLIGVSLEDATLQNLLRQNAVANPGHIHYLVHFLEDGKELDPKTAEAIFQANFVSYNLYTLFLTNSGIRNLASLIGQHDNQFSLTYASEARKFVYYLVGSVGSGKSTAGANFRNLTTYDEWIDPRRAELAKPDDQLTPAKRKELDRWIAEQFRKKNYAVVVAQEGIHLIDRCPLDPLTFGKAEARTKKAARLIREITKTRPIASGHIIYLDCAVEDLEVRNSFKHKYWGQRKLKKLVDAIDQVYGSVEKSIVCTRGRTSDQVAREIAKIIFIGKYREANIQNEHKQYVKRS